MERSGAEKEWTRADRYVGKSESDTRSAARTNKQRQEQKQLKTQDLGNNKKPRRHLPQTGDTAFVLTTAVTGFSSIGLLGAALRRRQ
ncbi:LPXTG cell wall anchor domain-containing protein [Collinsella sp. AGMB00827]|uniref:LPXTG cell wall anchor domain-containing protein n=1 Tax=Collinsella ureilytica TaxID=2869515 RepID=A0ABS7MJJ4_9ACTN|nr:LPXTG cell wall anchor domain-containing protein [Collinsella urealyticum]